MGHHPRQAGRTKGMSWVEGGRKRLSFFDPSQSRTTIQVNRERRSKSTANLTEANAQLQLRHKRTSLNSHLDFTSSERERPLWGCFWGAWRGTCLEVIAGGDGIQGDGLPASHEQEMGNAATQGHHCHPQLCDITYLLRQVVLFVATSSATCRFSP